MKRQINFCTHSWNSTGPALSWDLWWHQPGRAEKIAIEMPGVCQNGLPATVVTKKNICMMTSSNGNIFRVTGPFTGHVSRLIVTLDLSIWCWNLDIYQETMSTSTRAYCSGHGALHPQVSSSNNIDLQDRSVFKINWACHWLTWTGNVIELGYCYRFRYCSVIVKF